MRTPKNWSRVSLGHPKFGTRCPLEIWLGCQIYGLLGRKEGCPGQTLWHCILRMSSSVQFEYFSFSNSDGYILHSIDHPPTVMHGGRIKFRICGTVASLQIAGVIHILTNSLFNLIAKPKIYGDVFQFCPFGPSRKTWTVTGWVKCNHGPSMRTGRKRRTCNNHSRATRVPSVAEIFTHIPGSGRGDFWAQSDGILVFASPARSKLTSFCFPILKGDISYKFL